MSDSSAINVLTARSNAKVDPSRVVVEGLINEVVSDAAPLWHRFEKIAQMFDIKHLFL
jgi:hypothetical protein